jgi:hypothetical protein
MFGSKQTLVEFTAVRRRENRRRSTEVTRAASQVSVSNQQLANFRRNTLAAGASPSFDRYFVGWILAKRSQ